MRTKTGRVNDTTPESGERFMPELPAVGRLMRTR